MNLWLQQNDQKMYLIQSSPVWIHRPRPSSAQCQQLDAAHLQHEVRQLMRHQSVAPNNNWLVSSNNLRASIFVDIDP